MGLFDILPDDLLGSIIKDTVTKTASNSIRRTIHNDAYSRPTPPPRQVSGSAPKRYAPPAPPTPPGPPKAHKPATPPKAPVASKHQPEDEGLYSAQLEKLISLALLDGVLTEQEKQALFRRAEKEGIDLDEFEFVLEARLQERMKELNKEQKEHQQKTATRTQVVPPAPVKAYTPPPAAPTKSNKYGDMRKCPGCGRPVQSFEAICPDCGYEFSNVNANNSMERLQRLLMSVSSFYAGKQVWSEEGAIKKAEDEARDMAKCIENFPVPNTKGDLYEFIISAASNIKKSNRKTGLGDSTRILNKAWAAKCEQCYDKALFLLKDDTDSIKQIEEYLLRKELMEEETTGVFSKKKTGRLVWNK